MFRNVIYSICYVATLSYASVAGVVVSQDDPVYTKYSNYGHQAWKNDGERFIKEDFIDEYVKTGAAPILNDGKPEFEKWLACTSASGAFIVGWDWGTRVRFAKAFLESMLYLFQLKTTNPFDRVGLILKGTLKDIDYDV